MNVNRYMLGILESLVDKGGYVEVGELANDLQISRQTLHYYVDGLNEALETQGLPQVRFIDGGLSINAGGGSPQLLVDALRHGDYVFSAGERRQFLLLLMACCATPVTVGRCCDFFLVSRNTIIADIACLRPFIASRGVEIASAGRRGYRLAGNELAIRYVVMDAFYGLSSVVSSRLALDILVDAALGHERVLPTGADPADCRRDLNEPLNWNVRPEVSSSQLVGQFNDVIIGAEREIPGKLTYNSIRELTIHLMLAMARNRLGGVFAHDDAGVWKVADDADEWEAARFIGRRIHAMGLSLEKAELEYLAALLRGSRVFALDERSSAEGPYVAWLVKELVGEFEQVSLSSFENRDELENRLAPHVRAMLYRLSYQIKLNSAISKQVTSQYRAIFNLTNLVCKNMEEQIGLSFPENEVACLSIYFGSWDVRKAADDMPSLAVGSHRILVVCGSGVGTSLLIRKQLQRVFGSGYAYDLFNLRQVESADLSSYDLIVTTIPIPGLKKEPMLVSAILTKAQERRLLDWSISSSTPRAKLTKDVLDIVERHVKLDDSNDLLSELRFYFREGQVPLPRREFGLLDILTASRIQVVRGTHTDREAIELGCAPLAQEDVVGQTYARRVYEMIKHLGLYSELRPGILVAHADPSDDVHSVGMSLTVFSEPVVFSGWGGSFRVIFTLAAIDHEAHMPAMSDLMVLLGSSDACETLSEWGDGTPEALYLYIVARLNERM